MTGIPVRAEPSWLALFAAALIICPTVLGGVYGVWRIIETDAWKRAPEFRPVAAHPRLDTHGVIAWVERPPRASSDPGPGCVWVVDASGTSRPRRVGCSGDGRVPNVISGLSWTQSGKLSVHDPAVWPAPQFRVGAKGQGISDVEQFERMEGIRADGTRVHESELGDEEEVARLSVTPPGARRERPVVEIGGPDSYWLGEPQWSPDGRWILFSDIEGRLLITDEKGKDIRELLPPKRRREWVSTPFLTWHQGEHPWPCSSARYCRICAACATRTSRRSGAPPVCACSPQIAVNTPRHCSLMRC